MWSHLNTAGNQFQTTFKFTYRYDLVEDLRRLEIVMKTVELEFDAKRTLT